MAEDEQQDVKVKFEVPAKQISLDKESPEGGKVTIQQKAPDTEEEGVKTDYPAEELVKAPVKPPEAKDTKPPNQNQTITLLAGFAIAIVGLLCWPVFGFAVAIAILIIGAIVVAIATLIRL
jgi:hypothetical protein